MYILSYWSGICGGSHVLQEPQSSLCSIIRFGYYFLSSLFIHVDSLYRLDSVYSIDYSLSSDIMCRNLYVLLQWYWFIIVIIYLVHVTVGLACIHGIFSSYLYAPTLVTTPFSHILGSGVWHQAFIKALYPLFCIKLLINFYQKLFKFFLIFAHGFELFSWLVDSDRSC